MAKTKVFRKKSSKNWTRRRKMSINCKKPKGFSQKQYCKYGRKKNRKSHKKGGIGLPFGLGLDRFEHQQRINFQNNEKEDKYGNKITDDPYYTTAYGYCRNMKSEEHCNKLFPNETHDLKKPRSKNRNATSVAQVLSRRQ